MRFIFIPFLFLCVTSFAQNQQNVQDMQKKHRELMERIQKKLEADQKKFEQMFNDPVFKQFKDLSDKIQAGDQDFDQIIQQFQKSFDAFGQIRPLQKRAVDFRTLKEGRAYVYPYPLKESDSLDISVNKDKVKLTIDRVTGAGHHLKTEEEFSIPDGTDAGGMSIEKTQEETLVIFPWLNDEAKEQFLNPVEKGADDPVI